MKKAELQAMERIVAAAEWDERYHDLTYRSETATYRVSAFDNEKDARDRLYWLLTRTYRSKKQTAKSMEASSIGTQEAILFWRDNKDDKLYRKLTLWHDAHMAFKERYPRPIHSWENGYKQYIRSASAIDKKAPIKRKSSSELDALYRAYDCVPRAWLNK